MAAKETVFYIIQRGRHCGIGMAILQSVIITFVGFFIGGMDRHCANGGVADFTEKNTIFAGCSIGSAVRQNLFGARKIKASIIYTEISARND